MVGWAGDDSAAEPSIDISNKYAIEPLAAGVILAPKFARKKSTISDVSQDSNYRFILPSAIKQERVDKELTVEFGPFHEATTRKGINSDSGSISIGKALSKRKKDYESYDPEEEFDDISNF